MNMRRNIIAKQPNIMAPENTRRRLIMPTPRTVTICMRRITQLKRQSVTSSCTGISKPYIVERKARPESCIASTSPRESCDAFAGRE